MPNCLNGLLPILMWLATPLLAQEADTTELTTLDSVYTTAQARQGADLFDNVCIECHETSDFTKSQFIKDWTGETLAELFWYLRETMPENAPGFLPDRDYLVSIAFILSLNDLPAGERALPTETDALEHIRFTMPHERSEKPPPSGRWRHEDNQ